LHHAYDQTGHQSEEDSGEILLALLTLTRTSKKTEATELAAALRYPFERVRHVIEGLASSGLLTFTDSRVNINGRGRLHLAVEAVKKGISLERVCRSLDHREFEEIAAEALRANTFKTYVRFILRHGKRRYEIDLIGRRGTITICIDCKHWKHSLSPSRLANAAEKQVERTNTLVMELDRYGPKLDTCRLPEVIFIPAVLTLADTNIRTIRKVPIVPVLRLGSFLAEFDLYLDRLLVIKARPRRSQRTLVEEVL